MDILHRGRIYARLDVGDKSAEGGVAAMRVIQVVPSISAEASGPSYSVPALCQGLCAAGCEVSLQFTGEVPKREFGYPVEAHGFSRWPHPHLRRSPQMLKALRAACERADIIHNNSLWQCPNVYPAWAKKGTGCKLVMAPRGTMAAWSLRHHWLQKKAFGWYAQYAAMRETDMWHATCAKEYEEIRAEGYGQPVAIVPIGIDLPVVEPKGARGGMDMRKRLVFFGRLHKVKAVDTLILAWGQVAERFKDWELAIAGPDGGARGELEALVAERKILRVSFIGELNGQAKYDFLAGAELCVLPSYTENFGVTVAEALACGTPVIASQGTPWKGLNANRAGWWIPCGAPSLKAQLEEALLMPREALRARGRNGRDWMKRDFDWNAIGAKMKLAYEWLLGRGDQPEWVRND